ncbi:hypothetical protein [Clostridium sp. DL1XJH146]
MDQNTYEYLSVKIGHYEDLEAEKEKIEGILKYKSIDRMQGIPIHGVYVQLPEKHMNLIKKAIATALTEKINEINQEMEEI